MNVNIFVLNEILFTEYFPKNIPPAHSLLAKTVPELITKVLVIRGKCLRQPKCFASNSN